MLQGSSADPSNTATPAASQQNDAPAAQEAAASTQAKDAPAVATAEASPEMGDYDLKDNETTLIAEGQQDDAPSKSTADLTFDDMMAMPKVSHVFNSMWPDIHPMDAQCFIYSAGVLLDCMIMCNMLGLALPSSYTSDTRPAKGTSGTAQIGSPQQ